MLNFFIRLTTGCLSEVLDTNCRHDFGFRSNRARPSNHAYPAIVLFEHNISRSSANLKTQSYMRQAVVVVKFMPLCQGHLVKPGSRVMYISASPTDFRSTLLVLSLLCQLVSSQQSNSLTVDDNYVYETIRPDGIQYSSNWELLTGSDAPSRENNTLHHTITRGSNLVYFFQGRCLI